MQSFVVWNNEIEGRIDPLFYTNEFKQLEDTLKKCPHPLVNLEHLLIELYRYPTFYDIPFKKEGIPVVKVTNISKEGILKPLSAEEYDFIDEDINKKFHRTILQEEDLVLTVRGATIGKIALVPRELEGSNINPNLIRISLDKNRINPYYFWIYFNSKIGQKLFLQQAANTAKQTVTVPQIRSLKIPLPSNSVQNKIVDIMQSAHNQKKQKEAEAQKLLDSIDSYVLDELGIKLSEIKIKKCFLVWNNEVVQRLDPLYYSKDVFSFLKEFSYDVKPLEGITYYLKTGFAAGNSQQEAVNEGIIQIRPTNIDDGGLLRFDKNIYLKKEYLDKKNNDLLQKGEVLFNNTNSQELVGKTSFFDLEGQYFCSNHITRMKVDEAFISPIYLWIILNIYQKAKIFFNLCTNWNNQSGVNIELLKTVKIPFPPLEIQTKIAEEVKRRISEAERLKTEARKIIEEAKKKVEEIILGV
jgi:restriction endonuclease S subunit